MTAKKNKSYHWKDLNRDTKGRWVKAKKASKSSSNRKSSNKQADSKEEQKVTHILDDIKDDFSKSCPRCGGLMGYHKIRCGPEKLISVSKCKLCNYWIPATA